MHTPPKLDYSYAHTPASGTEAPLLFACSLPPPCTGHDTRGPHLTVVPCTLPRGYSHIAAQQIPRPCTPARMQALLSDGACAGTSWHWHWHWHCDMVPATRVQEVVIMRPMHAGACLLRLERPGAPALAAGWRRMHERRRRRRTCSRCRRREPAAVSPSSSKSCRNVPFSCRCTRKAHMLCVARATLPLRCSTASSTATSSRDFTGATCACSMHTFQRYQRCSARTAALHAWPHLRPKRGHFREQSACVAAGATGYLCAARPGLAFPKVVPLVQYLQMNPLPRARCATWRPSNNLLRTHVPAGTQLGPDSRGFWASCARQAHSTQECVGPLGPDNLTNDSVPSFRATLPGDCMYACSCAPALC
jgi:hypothetical protein